MTYGAYAYGATAIGGEGESAIVTVYRDMECRIGMRVSAKAGASALRLLSGKVQMRSVATARASLLRSAVARLSLRFSTHADMEITGPAPDPGVTFTISDKRGGA